MKLGRMISRLSVALLLSVGVLLPGVAAAATTTKSNTTSTTSAQHPVGGSVQGYAATEPLQDGTIVQLTKDSSSTVEPANSKNMNQMYGVTVDPHLLSLTISDSSLKNQVYVATSGTFDVIVNTQGGAIAKGDYVTLSAIDGVGMKAGSDESTVFGRAATAFDGKNNVIGTTQLKDTSGKTQDTVALGIISVAINIQRNPNEKSTKANLPKALQRLGEAIAEKPIGPLRIYLSIGITGLSIIVALVTLYAGIRNAIIAIGRNPLSKKSIFRGLVEIILTSFLILIIGLFAVYLLLKL